MGHLAIIRKLKTMSVDILLHLAMYTLPHVLIARRHGINLLGQPILIVGWYEHGYGTMDPLEEHVPDTDT